MPDDLYERDALAWSEHQASLLRRVARGERVNEVDWEHVIEEIEDVGLSQLNAVQSYLRLMLVHLLKVNCWPENLSTGHWRGKSSRFRRMPRSGSRLRCGRGSTWTGFTKPPVNRSRRRLTTVSQAMPFPPDCPFTLDQLLTEPVAALEARLTAAPRRQRDHDAALTASGSA